MYHYVSITHLTVFVIICLIKLTSMQQEKAHYVKSRINKISKILQQEKYRSTEYVEYYNKRKEKKH